MNLIKLLKKHGILFMIIVVSMISLTWVIIAEKVEVKSSSENEEEEVYQLISKLAKVFKLAELSYVEDIDAKKMLESAINGMLESLDPHSGYLNYDEFKDIMEQTKGEFGGLGIQITREDKMIKVISPIDDTPAFKAGIKAGDYISHLDQVSVRDETLTESIKKMKGKPGTSIVLTILRKGEKPQKIKIVRKIIKVKSVKVSYQDNVAVIRLSVFADTTQKELRDAIKNIEKVWDTKKLEGYVLDLRDNPGGTLKEAISVSDTFLDRNLEILSIRGRNEEEVDYIYSETVDFLKDKPIVILINGGSASASEIVAGALQHHNRAVVIGTKSFGKGSVQTVKSFKDGSGVKFTTARYFTPAGKSIQAKGIVPDIYIPMAKLTYDQDHFDSLFSESDFNNALDNEDKKNEVDKTSRDDLFEEDEEDDSKKVVKDFQMNQAVVIVKSIGKISRISNDTEEK
ncbi:MAG: S41 family peptidase [Alphaproteobacteria bacterium]|nr:S41 family peptidase [Alphaproteobacteria bacterium]